MELRMDRTAWIGGFHAGEAGRSVRTCPYPPASCESWSWSSGFTEGKAKRDGYKYSLDTLTSADLAQSDQR
jgi:ribosome modulation factor